MSILLKNATYIDWETLAFRQGDILVEEGLNGGISFQGSEPNAAAGRISETIDCSGTFVTKSFAIGHHHVYSALARGMPAPLKKPANFREILSNIWWKLDKCLDEEMIRYSALVTAMAAAKAGSSFVIDHHASPTHIAGSLSIIAEAFDEVGVGHLLCYEVTDRDGQTKALMGLQETERYLALRKGLVGLHASFTVGDHTLAMASDLMQRFGVGAHVHMAEDLYDQEHCLKFYGKRVMERWHAAGLLAYPSTILVHGLHLDDAERELFRNNACWVVQNMESNLKNRVGFFSSEGLIDRIMLGTDGMHSSMLQSARATYFAGQHADTINYDEAYKRLRNVHHYLQTNQFAGDGANCLVVLDYDHHTEMHQDNFTAHLMLGIQAGHVRDVIANGRLVVRNRQVCLVDQDYILEKARGHARRLWERMTP